MNLQPRAVLLCALLLMLAACARGPSKAEEEAAKNTFACRLAGERLVIRFDRGEARLLLVGGERVNLYQVPSAAGVRYTNGSMDLLGRGTDLRLARDGAAAEVLEGCAPLTPGENAEESKRDGSR
ncbi:MAG: MliC family protein [Pseudomonadota bacterium]|nr:MliC family protein [Pseudomonadota bacterium]